MIADAQRAFTIPNIAHLIVPVDSDIDGSGSKEKENLRKVGSVRSYNRKHRKKEIEKKRSGKIIETIKKINEIKNNIK